MRTTRLGVLFLGVSMLWVGCSVETTSDDDDAGDAGEGGSSASGGKAGSSSGKAGSAGWAGKAGSGGSAGSDGGKGGYSGTGNAGKGGTVNGGSAGTYAGSSGASPMDGGEGGWEQQAGAGGDPAPWGGEGGVPPRDWGQGGAEGGAAPVSDLVCAEDADSTPYPDCEPVSASNACELCIQENCCEESKGCWAFAPDNVCGWGGPDGVGEIDCYTACIAERVDEYGTCDSESQDVCADACATEVCEGIIGDQTWVLAQCMNTNCADECFGAECPN